MRVFPLKTFSASAMGHLAISAAAFLSLSSAALAETIGFGPFSVDSSTPNVIRLQGDIGGRDALNFRRAISHAPDADLLVLDSPGGLAQTALLIADDVDTRGLATLVPEGAQCFSACAFIYLAGAERRVVGELGVHQLSSIIPDIESAQITISDIIEMLDRFETPVDVLTIMFRTPAQEIHVFTQPEIERFGLNRARTSPASPEVVGSEFDPIGVDAPIPSPNLSAIEAYASRVDRLAIYTGLDFYGDDLRSLSVDDLVSCAASCIEDSGVCRAFTYNTISASRGRPNCFLKSDTSLPDGNAAAVSGVLLRTTEPDPGMLGSGRSTPYEGFSQTSTCRAGTCLHLLGGPPLPRKRAESLA